MTTTIVHRCVLAVSFEYTHTQGLVAVHYLSFSGDHPSDACIDTRQMKRKYSHQSKHLDICRRGHVGLLARTLECDGRRVRRHVTLGKQCEQFHGQGKDDRRVLLRRDATQGLQIPQL